MAENHMTLEVLKAMFKVGGNVPPPFVEHLTVVPNFGFNKAEIVLIRNLIIENNCLREIKDNDAILCEKAIVKFQTWLRLVSKLIHEEGVRQECFVSLLEKETSEFFLDFDTDTKKQALFVAHLVDYATREFQVVWGGVENE